MGRTAALRSPFWLHMEGDRGHSGRRALPAGSRQVSGVKAVEVDGKATHPGNAA